VGPALRPVALPGRAWPPRHTGALADQPALVLGIAAGLSAICYKEMASAVPCRAPYAYTTLGEFVAMGVAACLLLEYGVSISAVAVGWSGYLNELLDNLFGVQIPQSLSAAPWDASPGMINLPAVILIIMCALLLIRGASESALVNTVMVITKLGVLLMFIVIAFTAFNTDHFAGFWDSGWAGITAAASTIFFSYIGLDAVSTAGDEVKDPQRTMPKAIIGALIVVTSVYGLVAVAALGSQPTADFGSEEQATAGLAVILENITGTTWPSTIVAAGAVISIFSVSLVVMYGQTRILFAMGRDGLLPSMFAKVNPRTMTPSNWRQTRPRKHSSTSTRWPTDWRSATTRSPIARCRAGCWRRSKSSKPMCWCWVRPPTASWVKSLSGRRQIGCCTVHRSRCPSVRAVTAVRKSVGCRGSRVPIPALPSRSTWWNGLRHLRSDWMSRCGLSRSQFAAAPCIHRMSACAPRTQYWRHGHRTRERRWHS
jgi:Amino acid permease